MSNAINTELTPVPITAPKLGDNYGENVKEQFQNIDNNFTILANRDFVKGEDGKTLYIKILTLNMDINGNVIINLNDDGIPIDENGKIIPDDDDRLKNSNLLLNKIKAAINATEAGSINIDGINIFDKLKWTDNISIIYKETNYSPISSLPFVFLDARFSRDFSKPELNLAAYKDAKDYSCVIMVSLNTSDIPQFEAVQTFPTLYYDESIGTFCWKLNGNNSGLPAQGPQGTDGEDGRMIVTKIAKNTEIPGQVIINTYLKNNSWDNITSDIINDYTVAVVFNQEKGLDGDRYEYWVSPIEITTDVQGKNTYYVTCTDDNKISMKFNSQMLGDILNKLGTTDGLKGLYIPIKIEGNDNSGHMIYSDDPGGNQEYKSDLHIKPVKNINDSNYNEYQKPENTQEASLNIDYPITKINGKVAEGKNTIASGPFSHAEGENTKAGGQTSHAEGQSTTALGQYSHAEGKSSKRAPENITSNNDIINEWNTTKFNLAKGQASHVEGLDCLALGLYSHAEGKETIVDGSYGSHAEGVNTRASGNSSHVEGDSTNTIGKASHAEGYKSKAEGMGAHAEGGYKDSGTREYEGGYAKGKASHAEGIMTMASKEGSHSEGLSTIASEQAAHAEGKYTDATNIASHAEGHGTTAIGEASHAEGIGTTAIGEASHAEGTGKQFIPVNVIVDNNEDNAVTILGYPRETLDLVGCILFDGSNYYKIIEYVTDEQWKVAPKYPAPKREEKNMSLIFPNTLGDYSHTEGLCTIATGEASHAEGKYNVDIQDAIHMVGCGKSETDRKNAHVITKDGKHYIPGIGGYNGTNIDSTDKDLALIITNLQYRTIYVFFNDMDTINIGNIPGNLIYILSGQNQGSKSCQLNFKNYSDNSQIIIYKPAGLHITDILYDNNKSFYFYDLTNILQPNQGSDCFFNAEKIPIDDPCKITILNGSSLSGVYVIVEILTPFSPI